jgi:uncharacterized repeat protein (TIGR03803 family)
MKQLRALIGLLAIAALAAACSGGSTMAPPVRTSTVPSAQRHPAGYTLIYSFKGTPDGASPLSGMVAGNGTLYGTTLGGSSNYCSSSCGGNECYLGCGTVFAVDTSGVERVVYNFQGNFNNAGDGSRPFAGLTRLNGTLYGTASSAGAHNAGAVFTVSPSGSERILYSFAGGTDGAGPEAGLIAVKGKLYGATLSGGGSGCGGYGCGTVFEISTSGKERVIYSFAGGTDGAHMYSGVTALKGKLFGATLFGGGSGCGGNGCGTIFELTLAGKEHVVYRFQGTSDGGYPNGLTALNGTLYGTTEGGGSRSSGTFFDVTTSGSEKVLYNFQDIPDGNLPGANLIVVKGAFYGTTVGGGTAGVGTAFKVTTSGQESVLYSFMGGTDGSDPQGPLVFFNKQLYGTTYQGGGTGCGGNGCGTIFGVKP